MTRALAGRLGQPDTLLMLSGGLDSAYCLLRHVESGRPIRTHHVALSDWEGRADVEDAAVIRILDWMAARGYGALITHTRSVVDFGDLRWIPPNTHLWAYWAGAVMADAASKRITDVILPRHSDAFSTPDGPALSDAAYTTHISAISGRVPRLVFPMAHLTKAQVVAAMPPDLIAACWWCRTPRGGKPCHKCRTCKQVDPALP